MVDSNTQSSDSPRRRSVDERVARAVYDKALETDLRVKGKDSDTRGHGLFEQGFDEMVIEPKRGGFDLIAGLGGRNFRKTKDSVRRTYGRVKVRGLHLRNRDLVRDVWKGNKKRHTYKDERVDFDDTDNVERNLVYLAGGPLAFLGALIFNSDKDVKLKMSQISGNYMTTRPKLDDKWLDRWSNEIKSHFQRSDKRYVHEMNASWDYPEGWDNQRGEVKKVELNTNRGGSTVAAGKLWIRSSGDRCDIVERMDMSGDVYYTAELEYVRKYRKGLYDRTRRVGPGVYTWDQAVHDTIRVEDSITMRYHGYWPIKNECRFVDQDGRDAGWRVLGNRDSSLNWDRDF